MRSRRRTGIIAGKVRAALPKRASETSVIPSRRSRIEEARWRQSLKSPATMMGRSREASSSRRRDIASSWRLRPRSCGEKRMLRLDRAPGEAHGEALVQPLHLLQEHDVGIERLQALAQIVDHHAALEMR